MKRLFDSVKIVVPRADYDALLAAITSPPKPTGKLVRLMRGESAF